MDEVSLAHLGMALTGAAIDVAGQGLWPEHIAVVEAFLAVTTQFRVASIGGGCAPARLMTMGFDYAGVRAGLDAEGIAVTPDLWRGLCVMERAATAALNEGNR